MVARISGANMTRVNVTGIFEMIAISKIRSGPLRAIWMMPRAFAIGITSASTRCGRGPRLISTSRGLCSGPVYGRAMCSRIAFLDPARGGIARPEGIFH